jgi:hypothetical protein
LWAEEHGQFISRVGPFLERLAIERQACAHRKQFVSQGDKSVRAQSVRGRMAMLGLHVRQGGRWLPRFWKSCRASLPGRPIACELAPFLPPAQRWIFTGYLSSATSGRPQ